jgi:hypothetical protein
MKRIKLTIFTYLVCCAVVTSAGCGAQWQCIAAIQKSN